jgi:hypothetical protein
LNSTTYHVWTTAITFSAESNNRNKWGCCSPQLCSLALFSRSRCSGRASNGTAAIPAFLQAIINEVNVTAHKAKAKIEAIDRMNAASLQKKGQGMGSASERTRTSITSGQQWHQRQHHQQNAPQQLVCKSYLQSSAPAKGSSRFMQRQQPQQKQLQHM